MKSKRTENRENEKHFMELMRLKSLYGVEYNKIINSRHGKLWVVHWWMRSKRLGELFKKFESTWKSYASKYNLHKDLFAAYV